MRSNGSHSFVDSDIWEKLEYVFWSLSPCEGVRILKLRQKAKKSQKSSTAIPLMLHPYQRRGYILNGCISGRHCRHTRVCSHGAWVVGGLLRFRHVRKKTSPSPDEFSLGPKQTMQMPKLYCPSSTTERACLSKGIYEGVRDKFIYLNAASVNLILFLEIFH